jgi:thioredoxin reductase (NADPH)
MTIRKCSALLSAILKKRYEKNCRGLRAESGRAALDLLRRLQERNDAVSLRLVDHRMPEMNGVELLEEAITLYPNAKRALLTAHADTDAAIKAINDLQLNQMQIRLERAPHPNRSPAHTHSSSRRYRGRC